MSRKTAFIEEEFDDDTDLPLPAAPLPNTGSRGPLLAHISDDFDDQQQAEAGPATPPAARTNFMNPDFSQGFGGMGMPDMSDDKSKRTVTDITPYKSWSCIYPIYIDAKRPYGTGSRRIPRPKSVWWPLSKDIADACSRLGLGTLHEVNKSHPKDWENPGRVRVQWKKNGQLMNTQIRTKKELLLAISFQIQLLNPASVPQPPYITSTKESAAATAPQPPTASSTAKGKLPQSALKSSPLKTKTNTNPQDDKSARRKLPQPPEPHPPLSNRVSSYSPAIATGMLIDTVKAGMNAEQQPGVAGGSGQPGQPGTPGGAGAQGAAGKGKRKVIRVRG
ncbi:signal recognition particle, SRP19 subunit [Flagelloscypha sp. PMI_526]|nr:signal recognition particle, SRP19 subunit [Flagelloscypha sp. PMI_526]